MIIDTIETEEPGIRLVVDQGPGGWVELRYLDVDGPPRAGRLLASFMIAPHRLSQLINALGSCREQPAPGEA